MKRFPLINPQTPQTPLTPSLLLAVLGSCGDLGSPTDPGPDPDPAPGTQGGTVVGSGTFTLPGALASGDPGEHEVYLINHDLRPDLEPTSGRRLVVELDPELSIPEAARVIDQIEARLRERVPSARVIYIEPDIYDPSEDTRIGASAGGTPETGSELD